MSEGWRDSHCAQCGAVVGRIKAGSRGTMLCRACQEYDVPGGGECQMQEGLADSGILSWVRDQFRKEIT